MPQSEWEVGGVYEPHTELLGSQKGGRKGGRKGQKGKKQNSTPLDSNLDDSDDTCEPEEDLDPAHHLIRDLLETNPTRWTINTRLKQSESDHEWLRIARMHHFTLGLVEILRQQIIRPSTGIAGIGFNTYIHCAIDRGLCLLETLPEFAEFRSLKIRARSNIHLGNIEQDYLLDQTRTRIKVPLPAIEVRNIPIRQALGKRLSGFAEDCPIVSNDLNVLCVAAALQREEGVSREYVQRYDGLIDDVRRQITFKMRSLLPMVEYLESLAREQSI